MNQVKYTVYKSLEVLLCTWEENRVEYTCHRGSWEGGGSKRVTGRKVGQVMEGFIGYEWQFRYYLI